MQINALFYFLATIVVVGAVLLITRRRAASALSCLAVIAIAASAIFLRMHSVAVASLQLALGAAMATLALLGFRRESAAQALAEGTAQPSNKTSWTNPSWKNRLVIAAAAILAAIVAIVARAGTPHGLFLVPKIVPGSAQMGNPSVWQSLRGDYVLPAAIALVIVLIAATGYAVFAGATSRRHDAAG